MDYATVVDRALGLYLALYCVTIAVPALRLWRVGHTIAGFVLAGMPLTAYIVWRGALSQFTLAQSARLSLALLPAVLVPAMAPVGWVLRQARLRHTSRLASWLYPSDVRPSWLTAVVCAGVSIAGCAWLTLAVMYVDPVCEAVVAGWGTEPNPAAVPAVASCALPGVGAWPAIVTGYWWLASDVARTLEARPHG
jgi:hypothetical protein